MTTAPAFVVSGGSPEGEQLSGYVSPGESTTLRINKALGIRTRASEAEEAQPRQIVKLGSREMRKAVVGGELLVENHRGREVTIVVRRRFSGDLLNADGNPTKKLREEGLDSVNRRNELAWTLKLAPGAARTVSYRYSVLVPN